MKKINFNEIFTRFKDYNFESPWIYFDEETDNSTFYDNIVNYYYNLDYELGLFVDELLFDDNGNLNKELFFKKHEDLFAYDVVIDETYIPQGPGDENAIKHMKIELPYINSAEKYFRAVFIVSKAVCAGFSRDFRTSVWNGDDTALFIPYLILMDEMNDFLDENPDSLGCALSYFEKLFNHIKEKSLVALNNEEIFNKVKSLIDSQRDENGKLSKRFISQNIKHIPAITEKIKNVNTIKQDILGYFMAQKFYEDQPDLTINLLRGYVSDFLLNMEDAGHYTKKVRDDVLVDLTPQYIFAVLDDYNYKCMQYNRIALSSHYESKEMQEYIQDCPDEVFRQLLKEYQEEQDIEDEEDNSFDEYE